MVGRVRLCDPLGKGEPPILLVLFPGGPECTITYIYRNDLRFFKRQNVRINERNLFVILNSLQKSRETTFEK